MKRGGAVKNQIISVGVVTLLMATSAAAMPHYGDWSESTYVSPVNTAELEFASAISRDGLSLYFQRGDATVGGENIWVSHRMTVDDLWQPPEPLSANVNSGFNDRAAFVSQDGHWLYFASDRPGGRGGFDLMASWRAHVHDDAGWEPAVNVDELGAPLNTAGFDSGPTLFEDESGTTQMYFVSNPVGPQAAADIYRTTRNVDGSFAPPTRVAELSTTSNEGRPYLRHDGLEIFFNSNRPGGPGSADIWVSTRASTTGAWSAPQVVPIVSTAAAEITPVLSWDGMTLFFSSNRAGDAGNIFFATREKSRSAP